jgi:hypothetical protein
MIPVMKDPKICYVDAHLFFVIEQIHVGRITPTESHSAHIMSTDGNVFADLGFEPEQASKLKAEDAHHRCMPGIG